VYCEGNQAISGGGVYLDAPPTRLADSVLVNNTATIAGGGASANDLSGARPWDHVMERVELRGNTSPNGAGTDVFQTHLVLIDSVLEENTADLGGGVYVWPGSTLSVVASDFGVDALDNVPDDAWDGRSNVGWGDDVSVACDLGCGVPARAGATARATEPATEPATTWRDARTLPRIAR
ncbi:MAG: hypothetical protein ABMB14_30400, partial [Myxococcota bacterium]